MNRIKISIMGIKLAKRKKDSFISSLERRSFVMMMIFVHLIVMLLWVLIIYDKS